MRCKRCGSTVELQQHHIVPKSLGGTDQDGRITLCKKCHDILHKMIPKFMIGYVPEGNREGMRGCITQRTEWFIRNHPGIINNE